MTKRQLFAGLFGLISIAYFSMGAVSSATHFRAGEANESGFQGSNYYDVLDRALVKEGITVRTSIYPSRQKVKDYLARGVKKLYIESDYRPFPNPGTRVGYPSNGNSDRLNDLDTLDIFLTIDAGAYPSQRAAQFLNRLKDHVELKIHLQSCLTSNAEKQRLQAIARDAGLVVYCDTNRSYQTATSIARDLSATHPHLKISVVKIEE